MKIIKKHNWIQTHSGQSFYPFNPNASEIFLDDIIHSLSYLCRFNGHSKYFYSVAQHSVLVSEMCPNEYKLEGLLHDSAEAYISDIPHPIKTHPLYQPIQSVEDKILNIIYQKFNVNSTLESQKIVHTIDRQMLITEKRDLMDKQLDWGFDMDKYPPFDDLKIEPWKPEHAQLEFYRVFNDLYFSRNV